MSVLDALLEAAIARLGEGGTAAAAGALIGLLFGFFAHRSRFCLRSAVIEFARGGSREGRLTVWLFTFSTAVLLTQAFIVAGWLDVSGARQLSARGSLSGALIGGAMFGAGMILARGCSSRLLVLAAQGNLRALLSGLVFAVTAASALGGLLSPLRQAIAGWWTVEASARDVLALTGLGHAGGLVFGAVWLAAALFWGWRQRVRFWGWFGAIGVGVMVAIAWLVTYHLMRAAFDTTPPVQSLSFTGPAADVLMLVLSPPGQALKFDLGLVPGVFAGAFLSAALWKELKLEGFQGGQAMRRYIAGALLMGFGGMLAGGCAVGAGVSGAAVFTITSFVTLAAIWATAALVDRWLDRPAEAAAPAVAAGYARP
ncbi:MAG: YeeE/YedE family protein [Proteobacteria bacterium]|nr:YeeE/YedE family protein [Pseudomonadota bacterium]